MNPTRYYCPFCRQRLPVKRNLQPAVPMSMWNPDGDTLDAPRKLYVVKDPK